MGRGVAVWLPLAGLPLAGLVALRWGSPEAYRRVASYPVQTLVDLTLVMAVSVGLAVAGTQIIYSLRRAAARARELGQYCLQ